MRKLLVALFGVSKVDEWATAYSFHYFVTRSKWRSYWKTLINA